MRDTRLKVLAVLLAALASFYAGTLHTQEIGPFHQNLLEKGRALCDTKDFSRAIQLLHLACFGMLDNPEERAACLIYLGNCQAAAKDKQGFTQTVSRLDELERRFAAFQRATVDPEAKKTFERWVRLLLSPSELQRYPNFASFVPSEEERIRALPPPQRRSELSLRLRTEPNNPIWQGMLAELALAEGKFRQAKRIANQLLASHPEFNKAYCLRGQAAAGLREWAQAQADLEKCEAVIGDATLVATYLNALRAQNKGAKIEEFVKGLPDQVAADPRVAALLPQPSSSLPATMREKETREDFQSDSSTSASNALPGPSPADLASVRELLDTNQVQKALEAARQLVARFPQDRKALLLAGEAAYRSAAWQEAVDFFSRSVVIQEPQHQFYFAVALYEAGQKDQARQWLLKCEGKLGKSAFVEYYRRLILGTENPR